MLFVARQMQEKSREQNRDLHAVFVDLRKAFDTVSRPLLWEILRKHGCPDKFVSVLRALHDGATARVIVGGGESDPFVVGTGVRQGCVVAPVIFNVFVASVLMASHRHMDGTSGVGISYRLDGNLFNLRRLAARTKVTQSRVLDLQFADDAAFIDSCPNKLQETVTEMCRAYSRAGLKVSIEKTEVMSSVAHVEDQPDIVCEGQILRSVDQFKYLGSILSAKCDLTNEVHRRVAMASASFGKLTSRVFKNRDLTVTTRVAVYRAVCLSILLYGAEAWVPYRRHIKTLEKFHISCLQCILGLKWWHKVPHNEIRRRANIEPLETILVRKQLRWLGHVIRMPDDRLPKQALFGELSSGLRGVGGQFKRYKDHIKAILKKCDIQSHALEHLAGDSSCWRVACGVGTAIYTAKLEQAADDRRSKRRREPPPDTLQFPCNQCDKVCRSRIGLLSHQRAHQRRAGQLEANPIA